MVEQCGFQTWDLASSSFGMSFEAGATAASGGCDTCWHYQVDCYFDILSAYLLDLDPNPRFFIPILIPAPHENLCAVSGSSMPPRQCSSDSVKAFSVR